MVAGSPLNYMFMPNHHQQAVYGGYLPSYGGPQFTGYPTGVHPALLPHHPGVLTAPHGLSTAPPGYPAPTIHGGHRPMTSQHNLPPQMPILMGGVSDVVSKHRE